MILALLPEAMGNLNSCCAWRGPRRDRNSEGKSSWSKNGRAGGDGDEYGHGGGHRHDPGGGGDSMDREESGVNLQHISEREPDDFNKDPSVHPSAQTLFIEKSKRAIQNGMIRKKSMNQVSQSFKEVILLSMSNAKKKVGCDFKTLKIPNWLMFGLSWDVKKNN